VDLFVPISTGAVNLNTASSAVLQVGLGISDDLAANIIRARAGLDGMSGTEDDTPFQTVSLNNIPGMEALPPMLRVPTTVTSTHFEVVVDVWIGTTHRQCVALLGRGLQGGHANEGGVKVMQFSWRY
jgi:hypothetical protein